MSTVARGLEPLGASHGTLRPLNVFSTAGEAVPLRKLLPEQSSEKRCVVTLLRHFG